MDHILLLAVIGVVLFIVYIWYAGIIAKKNKALEALSGIDVQLKKRNNLIPNILKIAARFMNHEKELMEKITKLRTKVSDGTSRVAYTTSQPIQHSSKHPTLSILHCTTRHSVTCEYIFTTYPRTRRYTIIVRSLLLVLHKEQYTLVNNYIV